MNLNELEWTEKDYNNFSEFLTKQSEEKYKNFHLNLCKTSKREILGIRLPILQGIAKEIASGNYKEFLISPPQNTYEEVMIEGLVIAKMKVPFEDKIQYIERFIPKIDNWAVCDSVCAALKVKQKDYEKMISLSLKYSQSQNEYNLRFSVVLLMFNLKDETIFKELIKIINSVPCEQYYVSMAVAWAVSVCFVKFRNETMVFLKSNNLDDATFNRSLRKIIESNRVSKEDKDIIRLLKRQ